MNFKGKYPRLWNFFAAYFPDADLENLTDEAAVALYKSDLREDELDAVILELDSLIADVSYWEQAADDANRDFATPAENRRWLLMVRTELAD